MSEQHNFGFRFPAGATILSSEDIKDRLERNPNFNYAGGIPPTLTRFMGQYTIEFSSYSSYEFKNDVVADMKILLRDILKKGTTVTEYYEITSTKEEKWVV